MRMSEQPTATTSDLVPALPNLEVFNEWETWRVHCLSQLKLSRRALGQMALATGTELGILRAAMVLAVEEGSRAESGRLAMLLMRSTDPLMRLWGKFQLAYMKMLAGYTAGNDPELSGLGVVAVLQGILEDLNKLTDTRVLSFELQLRLYHTLADSAMLADQYDQARKYASETMLLAEQLHIDSIGENAKYQLARIEFWQGSLGKSMQMMEPLLSSHNSGLRQWVNLTYGYALYFSGWHDKAISSLQAAIFSVGDMRDEKAAAGLGCLKTFLLRDLSYLDKHELRPFVLNDDKIIVLYWEDCAEIFRTHPNKREVRIKLARKMRTTISPLKNQLKGWMLTYVAILEAYASLLAGDFGIAQRILPKTAEILACPTWIRCFGLAVGIESSLRLNPLEGIGHTLELANDLLDTLLTADVEAECQIAQQMTLVTPLAAALIACMPNATSGIRELGIQPILNLETRPVTVYGKAKISPAQASALILPWFGVKGLTRSNPSKKQLDNFENVLKTTFFEESYWREPIPPALISIILLGFYIHSDQPDFRRAAQHVADHFGLVPPFYEDSKFDEIAKVFQLMTHKKISIEAARQILFGGYGM
jgi:hypothetical protein